MMPGGGGEFGGVSTANDAQDEASRAGSDVEPGHEEVNALFFQHLDLVDVIAKHLSRAIDGVVEFDELLAAGREGLFDAARRFDRKQGLPFRAFAHFRVEGAT